MRRLLFSFVLLASAAVVACRDGGPGEEKPIDRQVPAALNGDFYKRLSGTIGDKAVVVHLHRMGQFVGGSYYYVSSGIPIGLYNRAGTVNDSRFELTEYDPTASVAGENPSPVLQLEWEGDGITGTWTSGDSMETRAIVLKEAYPEGSVRLSIASLQDSARMFSTKPEPMARVVYGSVVAAGREDSWLDAQIRRAFGQGAVVSSSWQEAFRAVADNYFDEYRSSDIDLDSNDTSVLQLSMHSYSTENRITVMMNDAGWLILKNNGFDYTGGAHGNHGSSFLNLDVKNKRRWKLTDVVSDTAGLAPFLSSAALVRFGIAPDESLADRLFVATIPVTENFYLSSTGLGFVYNPYEIASYADGEVHLFIPYRRLTLLLTEDFRKRMGLNQGAVMRG